MENSVATFNSGARYNPNAILGPQIQHEEIVMLSAAQSVTNSTTFVPITGFSFRLLGGGKYIINAYLPGTANVGGGLKLQLGATQGLTATTVSATGQNYNAATLNAVTTVTALNSAFGAATAVFTLADVFASIIVNAEGVLTLDFAQNASNAGATTLSAGSYMSVQRVF